MQDRLGLRDVVREHGIRRVIHLAAALGSQVEKEPTLGYQVNLMGGLNVFETAREEGIQRVVFASSKAVYGRLEGQHAAPAMVPVNEDYQGQPATVYGSTKKALEDAARQYRRLFGLDLVALRLGSTYGPGKAARTHGGYPGIKSRIVDSALAGEPLLVPTADLRDDIVYNGDVAKGAVLACFAPRTVHWQFHISGGQAVTLRDFTEEVMRLAPGHRLSYDPAGGDQKPADGENVTGVLSIDRARAELGYTPDFPGVTGIAHYIATHRDQQSLVSSI